RLTTALPSREKTQLPFSPRWKPPSRRRSAQVLILKLWLTNVEPCPWAASSNSSITFISHMAASRVRLLLLGRGWCDERLTKESTISRPGAFSHNHWRGGIMDLCRRPAACRKQPAGYLAKNRGPRRSPEHPDRRSKRCRAVQGR